MNCYTDRPRELSQSASRSMDLCGTLTWLFLLYAARPELAKASKV